MARELTSGVATGNFPPLVGIRTKGNYVKGKVLETGQTANANPVLTLSLIDMDGETTISPSKGVYTEVSVAEGDRVQIIGTSKQLKGIFPQLAIGDVVTITFLGKKKISGGKTLNEFKVVVED